MTTDPERLPDLATARDRLFGLIAAYVDDTARPLWEDANAAVDAVIESARADERRVLLQAEPDTRARWEQVKHPTWLPVAGLSDEELAQQAHETLVRVSELRNADGTLDREELSENLARGFECDREIMRRHAVQSTPAAASHEHPEATCQRCGRANVQTWAAPSPLWNAVLRSSEGDDRFAVVCPNCFAELAAEAGFEGHWRFALEGVDYTAIWHETDGRTWNHATWLWEDAAAIKAAPRDAWTRCDGTGMVDEDTICTGCPECVSDIATARSLINDLIENANLCHALETSAKRDRDKAEASLAELRAVGRVIPAEGETPNG